VHLIVAADSPGSIAALLLEKQQELEAAALVVASHGKQALQVCVCVCGRGGGCCQ
jgi:hypothetical protein